MDIAQLRAHGSNQNCNRVPNQLLFAACNALAPGSTLEEATLPALQQVDKCSSSRTACLVPLTMTIVSRCYICCLYDNARPEFASTSRESPVAMIFSGVEHPSVEGLLEQLWRHCSMAVPEAMNDLACEAMGERIPRANKSLRAEQPPFVFGEAYLLALAHL